MQKTLEGLLVVDLCLAAAGPICTRLLAECGAEVILVEPLHGSTSRTNAPHSFDMKCGGKKKRPLQPETPGRDGADAPSD